MTLPPCCCFCPAHWASGALAQVNFCAIVSEKPSKTEEYPIKGLLSKNHLVAATPDQCTDARSTSLLLGHALDQRRLGAHVNTAEDGVSVQTQIPQYIGRAVEEARRMQLLPKAAEEFGAAPDEAADARSMGRKLLATTSPSVTPAPILTGSIDNIWTALYYGRLATAKCYEHKHCKQGYITDPFQGLGNWGGGPGQFCAKDNYCYTCGDCQDDADAVDGKCPQDLCPGSGEGIQEGASGLWVHFRNRPWLALGSLGWPCRALCFCLICHIVCLKPAVRHR